MVPRQDSLSCSTKKWHASLGLWNAPCTEKRLHSVGVPSHKSINFSLALGQLREDDIHGFVTSLSSSPFVVFTDQESLYIYKNICLHDFPQSIRWCRKKRSHWSQELGYKKQHNSSFFPHYNFLPPTGAEHMEGQPECHSGLFLPPYKGNGDHWGQWGSLHGFQGPLDTDEVLPWTLHYIKPLLCLYPFRKLWEFALSICRPKSSYSALVTLREDGVCNPFYRADILGLMCWREDIKLEKTEEHS